MDLSVKIKDKTLQNPIGVASGTFGYGEEYSQLCNLSEIGAIYTKAITLEPRMGNETPRIVETPSGMLNAIGLANVGVKEFMYKKIGWFKENVKNCALIPNIAGTSEKEYCELTDELQDIDSIWGLEVNLSCPNVKEGAIHFGTNPKTVEKITKKIRNITKKPLIIKLSPNVCDICEIATAAQNGGADAVSCINTLVGMVIDTKNCRPFLANKTGGLSGPAIRPIGVRAVYQVSRKVKIPVIGMGGITNADDAIQYFLAGAKAIQIGTYNFVEPQISNTILSGIKEWMEAHNVKSVAEISGLMEN
jgi:dihydroorotate dehydrogenase (NAD+) catalytic subunit